MAFNGWPTSQIDDIRKKNLKTVAPLIISASRATDIPAFYSEWFFNCLKKGYLTWTNPFNGKSTIVSFENTRVIVFWTKNPKPIIPYLKVLDDLNIGYYFLFTLNDYEKENFEPHVPQLGERIDTFITLSQMIGKERVLWRFDPLIQTSKLSLSELTERIDRIGDKIHHQTEKLIFSFIQISRYNKVKRKLLKVTEAFNQKDIAEYEFSFSQKETLANNLSRLNQKWDLALASCAENIDLSRYGIAHNKCIDDELMRRIFPDDKKLMKFLDTGCINTSYQRSIFQQEKKKINLKDKGQRGNCQCIYSKDIGKYNTCPHLCVYCYANANAKTAKNNYNNHHPNQLSIC
jgi:DNA repair photolyase